MQWMILFCLVLSQNRLSLSWESSKTAYDPTLPCSRLPPDSESVKELQTPRNINTWYPIPKWKVFLHADKNKNGFSSPYFNSGDSGRTDGNLHSYADHSEGGKWQEKVFEKLTIRFLPLKDGNITVTSFEGRINSSKEHLALFVVYARGVSAERNNETETGSTDDSSKSAECTDADGCAKSLAKDTQLSEDLNNTTGDISVDHEVVTIPVMKNMTIEVKTGESGHGNYTVMILPVQGSSDGTTVVENVTNDEVIKIKMSSNMNIMVKSEEVPASKGGLPTHGKASELDADLSETESTTSSPISIQPSIMTTKAASYENATTTADNTVQTENTDGYEEIGTQTGDSTEGDQSSITTILFSKDYVTENELLGKITIETESTETKLDGQLNGSVRGNTMPYDEFPATTEMHVLKNDRNPKMSSDFPKYIYSRQFGPFEVKDLNSSSKPVIAVIHITLKNKDKNSEEQFSANSGKYLDSLNATEYSHFESSIKRTRRHVGDAVPMNVLYTIQNSKKSRDRKAYGKYDYVSNENNTSNVDSNNYSKKELILNPAEEASTVGYSLTYDTAILKSENREQDSNPPNLFLFQKENDSYSSEAISKSNEDFNQGTVHELGNKRLIINEISSDTVGVDGAESNQTSPGDENKREAVFPLLILQKLNPRENDSKKSELQMAERSSLDVRKMKTHPREKYSGRTDIKTGKICDLEDGCSEVNDAFLLVKVNESGYYEGRGRIIAHEALRDGKDLNQRHRSYKSREMSLERTMLHTDLQKDNDTDTPVATSVSFTNHDGNTYDTQRNFRSEYLKVPPQESNLKVNQRFHKHLLRNYNRKHETSFPPNYKDYANMISDLNRFANKQLKYTNDENKRAKMHAKKFNENQTSYSILKRGKRSWSENPVVANPYCLFLLIKIHELPHKRFPHILPPRDLPPFDKQIRGKNLNPNSRPKDNGAIPPGLSKPINGNKEMPRPDKRIPFMNRQNKQNSPNRMPVYDWVMMVPEAMEPFTETNFKQTPPARTFNMRMMKRKALAPERETEDDGREEKEWVLVNTHTTDIDTTRNIPLPDTSKQPKDDINVPSRTPKTADRSWIPEEQWKTKSYWKPLYYPRKTIVTTPQLTGWMRGGD